MCGKEQAFEKRFLIELHQRSKRYAQISSVIANFSIGVVITASSILVLMLALLVFSDLKILVSLNPFLGNIVWLKALAFLVPLPVLIFSVRYFLITVKLFEQSYWEARQVLEETSVGLVIASGSAIKEVVEYYGFSKDGSAYPNPEKDLDSYLSHASYYFKTLVRMETDEVPQRSMYIKPTLTQSLEWFFKLRIQWIVLIFLLSCIYPLALISLCLILLYPAYSFIRSRAYLMAICDFFSSTGDEI